MGDLISATIAWAMAENFVVAVTDKTIYVLRANIWPATLIGLVAELPRSHLFNMQAVAILEASCDRVERQRMDLNCS
jgi:hypothetical protein